MGDVMHTKSAGGTWDAPGVGKRGVVNEVLVADGNKTKAHPKPRNKSNFKSLRQILDDMHTL